MIKDLLAIKKLMLPELQLSHKSKHLLQKLLTEIHNASLLKPQVSPQETLVSFNIREQNSLGGNAAREQSSLALIPAPIQAWIKEHPMILRSYTLLVGGRTYNLHFYTLTRCSLTSHIQKINTWLTVASKYAEARCSKQVDAYLYLTPLKKVLPKSREQDISEEHANTAFTTSCVPVTEIVLFREEEWFKVFIHESFHNLGLDFSETYGQTKGQQLLKSMFQIKSRFRLYEVYCEIWAELICVIMQSMELCSRAAFPPMQYEKVIDAIQMERKFSMFQAAKILDFYGLNYEDLFYNGSNYNESTEVFCYYILKSLLMYNLNAFLEWAVDEQGGSLQFNKMKVEKFIKKLIVPYYKQRDYIDSMEQIQSYFDVPRSKAIDKTMRMTTQC